MLSDFKFAARALRRSPAFTAVSLVVLTLGIGATAAIYSVVDAVALKGMPFDRASELMVVGETTTSGGSSSGGYAAAPNFMDWRGQQSSFEDLAAFQTTSFPLYDAGKEPEALRAAMISPTLLPMLRVQPVQGQPLTAANEVRGDHRVALISTRLWQRRFGGDPAIVGKTFIVGDPVAAAAGRGNNGLWQIVGVMPDGFDFPIGRLLPTDVWVPWLPPADEYPRGDGGNRNYNAQVIGRLKPGVSREQAYAQMAQITASLKAQFPNWFRDDRWVSVMPYHESVVGAARGWMFLLLGSVAFVLLIACVNVANLMLARATERSRDVSVRAALGASRWQLARGLLAESLMLSVTGTVLGLVFATGAIGVLRSSLPGTLPRLAEASVDLRVLAVSALAAVGTGIFFGLLPAIRFSRPHLVTTLRAGGRSGEAGHARERARSVLLVAEVALAVMLLIGAGLFVSSFARVTSIDLGADIDGVLTMRVSPRLAYSGDRISGDQTQGAQQIQEVFTRLKSLQGVTEIAFMVNGSVPMGGGYSRTVFEIPGVAKWDKLQDIPDTKSISPGYFHLLRIPLVKGREFSDADRVTGAPQVVIINDVAAQRFFHDDNPIGRIVKANGEREIVGVVRAGRVGGPEADFRPEIFTPASSTDGFGATMFMRTSVSSTVIAPMVRQVVRDVLPTVIVPQPETLETMYGKLIAQRRFNMIVLALFGGLAIVIAAVGIYGVMTYLVTLRTHEIGIRMALGAKPGQVILMVLSRATVLMVAGVIAGMGGGWFLSKYASTFLFGVQPHDAVVYTAATGLLLAAGILAALLPARRAARIDPMRVLK